MPDPNEWAGTTDQWLDLYREVDWRAKRGPLADAIDRAKAKAGVSHGTDAPIATYNTNNSADNRREDA